jgi:hypothetical protein
MANNSHRSSADTARANAATSELPNVRERFLRSARAQDAAATSQEETAASLKVRQAETAVRRAEGATDHDEDIEI